MRTSLFFLLLPIVAFANPTRMSVSAGSAKMSENGSVLEITTSERSVIDWGSFSIGPNETTRFIQPSIGSAVLNRVVGSELSQIMGLLQSNGQVYLFNPNGMVIGPQGRIDTAAFIASTIEIKQEDFLKGGEMWIEGEGLGTITHLGKIETQGGPVTLIAHRLENEGEIRGSLVSLNAGHEILLDPSGSALLYIRPDLKSAGIDHRGLIEALEVQIQNDGGVAPLAINLTGIIEGKSVVHEGGKIFIRAADGNIQADGRLLTDSQGSIVLHAENGICELKGDIVAHGGEVRLLGEKIGLVEEASIDVSSDTKGGTVLIGGDYRGENPEIPNSELVYVGKGVHIDADSKIAGDGGKVILWANQSNRFYGEISAKGGSDRGDGGSVEISSPGHLSPNGFVSTLASNGKHGKLYMDPTNVCIAASADTCVSFASNLYTITCATSPTPCDGPFGFSGGAIIDSANLIANLNAGNVTIDATSTNFNPPGLISFNDNISWSSDTQFQIIAGSDVSLLGTSIINTGTSGSLLITSGGAINLLNATISVPTSLTLSSPGFFILSGTVTINTGGNTLNLSGTPFIAARGFAPVTLNSDSGAVNFLSDFIGTGLILNASSANVTFTGNNSSSLFTIDSASFNLSGPGSLDANGAPGPSNITINASGDINILGSSVQVTPGSSSPDISFTAGGNINLGTGMNFSTDGNINLIAGSNISAVDGTLASSGATGRVTLVADNNFPSSVGTPPGTISVSGLTFTGNKILFYAAEPGINSFPSTINGVSYTPGSFSGTTYIPGTNEQVGVFYPSDPLDPPFVIYYKSGGSGSVVVPPMAAATVQQIQIAITEPVTVLQTIQVQSLVTTMQGGATPDPAKTCGPPSVSIRPPG